MSSDLAVSGREGIADWVEATLLVRDGAQLGMDALQSLALEEIGAAGPQVQLGLAVMSKRSSALNELYPFEVVDWAVRSRPGALSAPYSALTLLTPSSPARQLVHRSPTPEMAVLFERLVERAVIALWGHAGRAVRFAWPGDTGRPPEFPQAVEWLARLMGLSAGRGYRPPRRKDGGVDVIGWRPFSDGRSGFPILLVQCTLQGEILSKARDVDARLWSTWLVMDGEPQTALAVPQTITEGTLWDELAISGMVLERMRLTSLIGSGDPVDGLGAWVSSEVAVLRTYLKGGEL